MSKQVILTIPDSVDLSALREMKLILRYYKDGNDLYEYSTDSFSLSEENGDLISRNLAIAYAKSGLVRRIDGEDWIRISEVVQSLKDVPTTTRPEGEWEDYSVDFYKCPECGYLLNKDCPHCQTKVILPKGGAE